MDNLYCPEGMNLTSFENRKCLSDSAGIEEAMSKGFILEARAVMCDSQHNLQVDL